MTHTIGRLDTLSDDQLRDLIAELRQVFPRVHARSVELRRIIREANDELARTTARENDILTAIDDLLELLP